VAAPPPPGPELIIAKANQLADDLRAALSAEPGDARALEVLATLPPGDAMFAVDPALKPLVKIARARALLLQARVEEASALLNEARPLVAALSGRSQRALVALLRYREAEIDETRARAATTTCGALGLRRISLYEGKSAGQRVEEIAAKYRHAVVAGERFWSRRAAFRIAVAHDDFYRRALAAPSTYRGVPLPSPLSMGRVDTQTLLAGVLGGAWPEEISRLYSEVIASVDARAPDAALLAQARERAAAFARLETPRGETAENPWFGDEKPGLVRFSRQWQRMQADGTWSVIKPDDGQKAALEALALPLGSIERAYALVSLAEAGAAVPPSAVLEALATNEPRIVLAGILAAEKNPELAFFDLLVVIAAKPTSGVPFGTLQDALYGPRERALLALRALVNDNRAASEVLLADERLAVRERAWIVAELGESRLQYALQGMLWDKDSLAAATALYALVGAAGNKGAAHLRPTQLGPVGCVSKVLADTAR
jgi:hypothetical protein